MLMQILSGSKFGYMETKWKNLTLEKEDSTRFGAQHNVNVSKL
jgi:hypothetical protein